MKKKRLIIIRSNTLDRCIRIPKEISALNTIFSIIYVGWNRDYSKKNFFIPSNKEITQKLLNLKAPYGKLILLYIPIWWIYVFFGY